MTTRNHTSSNLAQQLIRSVIENPLLLEKVIERLDAKQADVRFGSAKALRLLSETRPEMITAANVIQGGARIARAKPQLADGIAAEVLKEDRALYRTAECRNVAIGHAIRALGEFADLLQNSAPALRFARKHLRNSRPATRKKAEQFLIRCNNLQPG